MFRILLVVSLSAPLAAQTPAFRDVMKGSTRLPLHPTELRIEPPSPGWSLDMVSSVAVDREGLVYLLQRGSKADPVIVVNQKGKILRSWGKGLYTIPHNIRIDPAGNVWTVDAGSSII